MLEGRYEVLARIGAGAHTECWRAAVLGLRETVALVRPSQPDGTLRRRLSDASTLQASFQHQNFLPALDLLSFGGAPLVVLPFGGECLEQRLARGPLAFPEVETLARQSFAGVEALHALGFVHRNLSARKVLLGGAGGVAKVTGLLFAARAGTVPDDDPQTLFPGITLTGDPRHTAPEWLDGRPRDPRLDVWSLGVLVYRALTGTWPFDGPDAGAIITAIRRGEPRPLPDEVPLRVRRAVAGALVVDPSARWPSVAALRAAWEGAASPGPRSWWRRWVG